MKHYHRMITPILATVLLASSVISCGSDVGTPIETAADTAPAAAESVTEALSDEYEMPDVDYNGETFTIAAMSGIVSLWRAVNYCEIFSAEENGDPLNDAIYKRNLKIAETLNVAIECYPLDD